MLCTLTESIPVIDPDCKLEMDISTVHALDVVFEDAASVGACESKVGEKKGVRVWSARCVGHGWNESGSKSVEACVKECITKWGVRDPVGTEASCNANPDRFEVWDSCVTESGG